MIGLRHCSCVNRSWGTESEKFTTDLGLGGGFYLYPQSCTNGQSWQCGKKCDEQ